MIIKNENKPINFGDTSFRRKKLLDDYKTLLNILNFIKEEWSVSNNSQNLFYQYVLDSGLIEKTDDVDINDQKKRGRTYTNALVKLGLINKQRVIAEIGYSFLNDTTKQDETEQILNLSNDNVLFLRQLLKLKIVDESNNGFYIFRVALAILMRYDQINRADFSQILLSIEPNFGESEILNKIDNYKKVVSKKVNFNEYFKNNFLNNENVNFEDVIISDEIFKEYFKNRKTDKSVYEYMQFYKECIKIYKQQNLNNLKQLIKISKEPTIKKAFGFGKIPFDFSKNIKNFYDFANVNTIFKVPTLKEFNNKFYQLFKMSKKYDLMSEYEDMLVRTFKLTGLISFDNAVVSLPSKEIIKEFCFNMNLTFKNTDDSDFFHNISTSEILCISHTNFKNIDKKLRDKFNVLNKNITLGEFFKDYFNNIFEYKISSRYSDKEICDILSKFWDKNKHEEIQKQITDLASISTIFEYIVAIAWHRISNKSFNLKESMNLTLDADGLPISHAPGGDGDIIARHKNFDVMLEATLMDKNSQKRGELEPVIRHSINLTISNENFNKKTYTFFIADELDTNVINIFRACANIELESSENKSKFTNGVRIFSLDTEKLIYLLKNKKNYLNLINTTFKNYNKTEFIKNSWFNETWQDIKNLEAMEN